MDTDTLLTSRGVRLGVIWVLVALTIFLASATLDIVKGYKFIGGGVPSSNVITVSGEGEVFAVPDIGTFDFSVEEERKTAEEAQNASARKVNGIIDFLKKEGIDEKDIKTSGYNLYPRYEYPEIVCMRYPCPRGERVMKGFVASQRVTVKVRDTDKAGGLLSGVGKLGATNISALDFTIDDRDKLDRQARKLAIDDAKEKASALAKDLGVDLVRVVNFSEGSGFSPRYFAESASISADGAPPEIPVGENKITSNVMITYEIR